MECGRGPWGWVLCVTAVAVWGAGVMASTSVVVKTDVVDPGREVVRYEACMMFVRQGFDNAACSSTFERWVKAMWGSVLDHTDQGRFGGECQEVKTELLETCQVMYCNHPARWDLCAEAFPRVDDQDKCMSFVCHTNSSTFLVSDQTIMDSLCTHLVRREHNGENICWALSLPFCWGRTGLTY